jgi:threonine/homoserine/homoserine lactone efflux protein
MSFVQLFVTGMAIGLIMAVPVGPVNLLAVSRTLRFGFLAGFVAGLGGMVADSVFAAIAAFGITRVIDFVEGNAFPIQLVGGLLLVAMGIAAMRSHPHLDRVRDSGPRNGVLRGGVSGFFMTVTNPGAALAMLALFGSLGDIEALNTDDVAAVVVVAGVAAGSTIWWFVLATMVGRLRDRMSDDWLAGINRVAGVVLIVCGAGLLAGLALGIEIV